MKPLSHLNYLHLTRFSKPVADRPIYQSIRKFGLRSIVEAGLADGQRCEQMIRVAARYAGEPIRYTGIDQFDARAEDRPPLRLIETHRRLKAYPAKIQLVPGDFASALERIANSHLRTDLLIVSSEDAKAEFDQALLYIPRMLHAESVVMVQPGPDEAFDILTRLDIERRLADAGAGTSKGGRRAA